MIMQKGPGKSLLMVAVEANPQLFSTAAPFFSTTGVPANCKPRPGGEPLAIPEALEHVFCLPLALLLIPTTMTGDDIVLEDSHGELNAPSCCHPKGFHDHADFFGFLGGFLAGESSVSHEVLDQFTFAQLSGVGAGERNLGQGAPVGLFVSVFFDKVLADEELMVSRNRENDCTIHGISWKTKS